MVSKMDMCVQLAEDYAIKSAGAGIDYEKAYIDYMDRCVKRSEEAIKRLWHLEFKIPEPLLKVV